MAGNGEDAPAVSGPGGAGLDFAGDPGFAAYAVERLAQLESVLTSRIDFAAQHGLQYGRLRNLYRSLGYQRAITLQDYRERYERGGIAARIVDAKPKATWREEVEVTDRPEDESESTESGARRRRSSFDLAWARLAKRVDVFAVLERADLLSGIGHYGILLVGLRDGGQLDRPARAVRGHEDVLYLQPYAEESARVERVVDDPSDPRFGLPLLYRLSPSRRGVSTRGTARSLPALVHWSRVVHVAEGLGENEVFGTPRLRSVWNYLDDLDKTVGGSAEMGFRQGYQGLHADVKENYTLSPDDKADLETQFEEYEHRLRRFLRTRGIELTAIGGGQGTFPNPQGSFRAIVSLVSGTTGIPQRILLGSEQGQLASQQDRDNWNERVAERQSSFAGPGILHPLVRLLIAVRALPRPRGGEFRSIWPDLMATPLAQRALIGEKVALGAQRIAKGGGTVVAKSEFREMVGLPPQLPDDADPDGGSGSDGEGDDGGSGEGDQ